jgi:hypothetical protein
MPVNADTKFNLRIFAEMVATDFLIVVLKHEGPLDGERAFVILVPMQE